LLVSEAFILAFIGVVTGVVVLQVTLTVGSEWLLANTGMLLSASMLSLTEWALIGAILAAAVLLSFIPAWRAYRNALADGLTIRI